jgi:hypothetical protein
MFTSISSAPSHENRLLATPEHYCISFDDAKKFRDHLLTKLPSGSRITIDCAATGGLAGYDEKWVEDNIPAESKATKLFYFSFQFASVMIGQNYSESPLMNVRELAETFLVSPRRAFESIFTSCGATQDDVDRYHLSQEPVQFAIEDLYK